MGSSTGEESSVSQLLWLCSVGVRANPNPRAKVRVRVAFALRDAALIGDVVAVRTPIGVRVRVMSKSRDSDVSRCVPAQFPKP